MREREGEEKYSAFRSSIHIKRRIKRGGGAIKRRCDSMEDLRYLIHLPKSDIPFSIKVSITFKRGSRRNSSKSSSLWRVSTFRLLFFRRKAPERGNVPDLVFPLELSLRFRSLREGDSGLLLLFSHCSFSSISANL